MGASASTRHVIRNEAFIWQRAWAADTAGTIRHAPPLFTAWHVLAADISRTGGIALTRADWTMLNATGRTIIPVIRTDVHLAGPNPALAAAIAGILARLPLQAPATVELDYDAPTALLPAYAAFLTQLRRSLPPGTALAITALPTWLQSPAFTPLAEAADTIILQLHAVEDPRFGLFDPERAARWTSELAARCRRPFLIALPAYGARTVRAPDGRLLAASGEAGEVQVLAVE